MEVFIIIALVVGSCLLLLGLGCYLLGFRSIGIASHSIASCCQSFIGNVVRGSCFAIMTCLGMRDFFILMAIVGLVVLSCIVIYLIINSGWLQSFCNWIKNFFNSEEINDIKGFLKWQLRKSISPSLTNIRTSQRRNNRKLK